MAVAQNIGCATMEEATGRPVARVLTPLGWTQDAH